MASNTVVEAKKEEEKYLAARTTQWLEGLLGQKLSAHGLGLAQVLKNGKVLKRAADVIAGRESAAAAPFSKKDLEEERKGFQAILDVDNFLNFCRSQGLKDHQLFNASDVTTCSDLLRVCRTVRSLSLSCAERGIKTPVFETGKQKVEARRRSMSTEATSTKVEALKTLDKMGTVDEKGEGKSAGGPKLAGLAVAAVGLVAGALFLLRPKTYVVKKGDTLSSLAGRSRGKVSLSELVKKNPNIKDANKIYPKDKINM